MHRLFVALRPPPSITALLDAVMESVPGARWQDEAQLHLTLRYIGEVDRHMAEDVVAALGQLHSAVIAARLSGVGVFDKGGRANALWAGVAPVDALGALHRKIDHALVRIGLPPEGRAFVPHITVARLSRGLGAGRAVARWRADHAALASPPFRFEHVVLFESRLGAGGADYAAIARWRLHD